MLDLYHLSICGADEGDCVVCVCTLIFTHFSFDKGFPVYRFGIHCHQIVEAVSSVNIKHLTYGAESVCRIDVTPVLLIEVESPVSLVFIPEGFEVIFIVIPKFGIMGYIFIIYFSELLNFSFSLKALIGRQYKFN